MDYLIKIGIKKGEVDTFVTASPLNATSPFYKELNVLYVYKNKFKIPLFQIPKKRYLRTSF